MLHCDLGQRWPLSSCPTRVNPEIKKQYALERGIEGINASKRSICGVSSWALAALAGCSRETLFKTAKELYKKTPSNCESSEIDHIIVECRRKAQRPQSVGEK